MEKLIELLNETCNWENLWKIENWIWLNCPDKQKIVCEYINDDDQDVIHSYIISKKFWFIKWLVDNDKIDRYKFEVEYMDKQTLEDVYIAWAKQNELLIMILAISDTPIEFLISILKNV